MQLGLLFESQLSERDGLNVLQIVCRFEGEAVDAEAMTRAWQRLADRHEALRIAMDPLGAQGPRMTILPPLRVDLPSEDWTNRAEDVQEGALAEWLRRDRRRGVVVEHCPAWRLMLLRLGPLRSVMVWTFHHSLLDGTSFRLLLDDVFDLYDAFRSGSEPSPGIVPEGGFRAFAQLMAETDHAAGRAHFRELLAGYEKPNELDPVFRVPRLEPGSPRRCLDVRHLDPQASGALRARAAEMGVTTATMLQAAWGIVLARCSGQSGAVFGLTRTGRHLAPGMKAAIGCLINTLPFRVAPGPETTLQALLKDLRGQTLALHPHEQTPLNLIAQDCELASGRALFGSILMFDRDSLPERMRARGPEWQTRHIEEISEMATPLTIAVHDDPAMMIRLEYDPEVYAADGISRIGDYLLRTLTALTELPGETPLREIGMVGEDEAAALLKAGLPARPTPPDVGATALIDRFEAIAARRPTAPALGMIGTDTTLSYRALDEAANEMAHRLRAAGVGPGDLVGIALPRSPQFIVTLLGILKAEAAFMPFDIAVPPATLSGMLARSGAACIVAEAPVPSWIGTAGIPCLAPVVAVAKGGAPPAPLPRGPHDPARLAYVIHTSGTTGQPKGVAVPHRALSHHAAAMIDAFELTEADSVLQFISLGFDISIEEILPTLVAGARLVLRDDESVGSMSAFLAGIASERVTVVNLPTAFWHLLVEHLDALGGKLPPSLGLMVVGGEKVSAPNLARWRRRFPDLRWLNGYGPTETTITATVFDPDRDVFDGSDVPIGRPVGHARAYVLTEDRALAPMGVAGELWIGGPAVATGYLHRPDLTAPVFLPDPFDPAEGSRIYRTGDRAFWRPDGTLAYRGRADRQVKLRGYRIELAAIEAALEAEPEIAQAVVAVDAPETAAARLLAWVRPHGRLTLPEPEELRQRLSRRLAAPLVPLILPITTFPETAGGKIDMARLPRPVAAEPVHARLVEADPAAERICTIFKDLLGVEDIPPDASFFDLGGHSLLSIRLMSQIEGAFGTRLSLADLYDDPTPRGIAARLRGMDDASVPNCLIPIQPEGQRPPLLALHILGPNAAYYRPLAAHLGGDQPLIGLTMDLLDPATPTNLADIAAIYRANIEREFPTGPVSLIAVSQGAYVAFELAQQLHAAGRDVAGLYLIDATGPGGRPQIARRKPLGHYARALVTNLPGVIKGRTDDLRVAIAFHTEKLRIRLAERLARRDLSTVSITTHQAVLELRIDEYQPQPFPRRMTIFRSTHDDRDTPEAIRSGLGWSDVAVGGFELVDLPGDHLSILEEPNVTHLALELTRRLSPSEAGQGAVPARTAAL